MVDLQSTGSSSFIKTSVYLYSSRVYASTASFLQPLYQGVIAALKAYYVRRTFQRLLKNMMEEDPELTTTQAWTNYIIVDCLVNIKELYLTKFNPWL